MKNIIYILSVILFFCCSIRYKVSPEGVISNMIIDNICISKVDSVNSYDRWNVPDKFHLGEKYCLEYETNSSGKKKVLFYVDNNTEYYWHLISDTNKKIPDSFFKEGWYVLSGIKTFDKSPKRILFFIDENGKVSQYYRSPY